MKKSCIIFAIGLVLSGCATTEKRFKQFKKGEVLSSSDPEKTETIHRIEFQVLGYDTEAETASIRVMDKTYDRHKTLRVSRKVAVYERVRPEIEKEQTTHGWIDRIKGYKIVSIEEETLDDKLEEEIFEEKFVKEDTPSGVELIAESNSIELPTPVKSGMAILNLKKFLNAAERESESTLTISLKVGENEDQLFIPTSVFIAARERKTDEKQRAYWDSPEGLETQLCNLSTTQSVIQGARTSAEKAGHARRLASLEEDSAIVAKMTEPLHTKFKEKTGAEFNPRSCEKQRKNHED